ncbi:MAG: lipocalin family protein [Turneriella sp.]
MKSLYLLPLLMFYCASPQPMPTVAKVDLPRFMGKWYVIANIPTFIEKGAHNATEEYSLTPEQEIDTVFTFRADSFDGKEKKYHPRGFVVNRESNAEWKMQFMWPFKSEFLISYLNADYSQTIIGRTDRDYVWIMARTPQISESDYNKLVTFLAANGYDTSKIQKVPQRW